MTGRVTVDNASTHLVVPPTTDMVSSLVLKGDLSGMKPAEKVEYYNWLCKSLGLNPSTKPFEILNLKGKEIMYAKKDATEQLRKIYGVSVVELTQTIDNGLCISKCRVQDAQGRFDVATGVTVISAKMTAEDTANAIMKSETKAKRRATLSICGLGMLDETELDTVGHYETVPLQEIASAPKKLLKDLIVAKRELEDALSTEELKQTWLKYPEWHKETSFLEIKELRKSQLQMIEAIGDVDILALIKADSTEVLSSLFHEIQSRPVWEQYVQDHKDLIQKIYSIKSRRLNVELDAG